MGARHAAEPSSCGSRQRRALRRRARAAAAAARDAAPAKPVNVSASAPSPVCARRVSTAAGPFVAEPASPPGFGGSAGRGGSAGSCGPSGPPGASGPAGSSGTVGSSVAGGVGGPSGSSPRRPRHQYSQIQDSRGRSPPLLGMPTAPAEPEPPRQRRGPALRSSGQALEGDTPPVRHFSNAAPRRTMMISFLSVIADLAAHHGKQLVNEMPASFTVNAKRSAVRARATGSLLL